MNQDLASLKALVTACFVGTWIILGVGGLIFSRRADVATERRWTPRMTILVGVLFVFFSTTLTVLDSRSWSGLSILLVVVPAVALISWLNIRNVKVCDGCGATLSNQNWFKPMRFCPHCGAEIDGKPPPPGEDLLE